MWSINWPLKIHYFMTMRSVNPYHGISHSNIMIYNEWIIATSCNEIGSNNTPTPADARHSSTLNTFNAADPLFSLHIINLQLSIRSSNRQHLTTPIKVHSTHIRHIPRLLLLSLIDVCHLLIPPISNEWIHQHDLIQQAYCQFCFTTLHAEVGVVLAAPVEEVEGGVGDELGGFADA